MKKINIITGHYGSGKTNLSVNLALSLTKKKEKVTVVDLDIVNPYFRTADFTELFSNSDVTLVKSMYANSNLDIPAISFDLERIATEDGYLIVDVGGDDDGALALGRYAEAFKEFSSEIEFIYVVNRYRHLTETATEAADMLYAIEKSSRMKVTCIVNNSNLGNETTTQDILDSYAYGEEISAITHLPLKFTTAPRLTKNAALEKIPNLRYLDIYVKQIWDEGNC